MKKEIQSRPFDVRVFDIGLKVYRSANAFSIRKVSDLDAEGFIPTVHSHFTYEIFFVTEGALELVMEGQTRTYERKVLIIPPKIKHYSLPSKWGSFSLLFSFEETLRPCRQQTVLERLMQQGICELPLTEDISFYMRKLSQKSTAVISSAQQDMTHLASLLLSEVFSHLLPTEQIAQPREKGSAKHIYAIESYINARLSHRISLSEVAQHMALSTRQVSRIIQKEYGCTLSQLITEKRLSSAEQLVRSGELSIEQIAAQSGLGSANYFYTLFKKHYGMTPLQYRKHHLS